MHADVEFTLLGHAFVANIPSVYERLKLQVEYIIYARMNNKVVIFYIVDCSQNDFS